MERIRVGALFAGYGGIELALAQVAAEYPGVEVELVWYCEVDKAASAILAHRYPGVPNLGDVTKVDWAWVAATLPVDVITGGSPCQDLSHAGKRAGMKAGTRSGLWASMCDAIDIIRPRLVVWENVRGALSAGADSALEQCAGCVGGGDDGPVLRALGRVLGDLAELRYDARWYGLRASDVELAHGRFRVFLFATPADARGLGGLEAFEHDGRRQAEGYGRGVPDERDRDALRAGPLGVPGQLTLLPTPAVNDMGAAYTPETWDAWTERMKSAHGNGNGHGKSLAIEAQRLLPTPRTSDTNGAGAHGTGGTKGGPNQRGSSGDLMLPSAVAGLGKHDGPNCGEPTRTDVFAGIYCACERSPLPTPRATRGGSSSEIRDLLLPTPTSADSKASGGGYNGQTNVTLTDATVRQAQDWREYEAAIRRQEHATGRTAPPPTETGPKGNPRLSPRFVEWLMGLPEGWVTDVPGISRNDQLKALGNGVVPAQCAAALRAFLHDTSRTTRTEQSA